MNINTELTVLVLRLISTAVTGVLAIVNLLVSFKDSSGHVTIWGRRALAATVLSCLVTVGIITTEEWKKRTDAARANERADAERRRTEELLRSTQTQLGATSAVLSNVSRVLTQIGDVAVSVGFEVPLNEVPDVRASLKPLINDYGRRYLSDPIAATKPAGLWNWIEGLVVDVEVVGGSDVGHSLADWNLRVVDNRQRPHHRVSAEEAVPAIHVTGRSAFDADALSMTVKAEHHVADQGFQAGKVLSLQDFEDATLRVTVQSAVTPLAEHVQVKELTLNAAQRVTLFDKFTRTSFERVGPFYLATFDMKVPPDFLSVTPHLVAEPRETRE